jgi:hypothetical protein
VQRGRHIAERKRVVGSEDVPEGEIAGANVRSVYRQATSILYSRPSQQVDTRAGADRHYFPSDNRTGIRFRPMNYSRHGGD